MPRIPFSAIQKQLEKMGFINDTCKNDKFSRINSGQQRASCPYPWSTFLPFPLPRPFPRQRVTLAAA